jgi:hypothetical protein
MAGIRVTHESLRNGILAVQHPTKKYVVPYACPRCNVVHLYKVIHVWIDNEGAGIISPEGYELLRQSGMPGLTFSNVVENPPTQFVNQGQPQGGEEERKKQEAPVKLTKYDGQFPRVFNLVNRLFIPKGENNG